MRDIPMISLLRLSNLHTHWQNRETRLVPMEGMRVIIESDAAVRGGARLLPVISVISWGPSALCAIITGAFIRCILTYRIFFSSDSWHVLPEQLTSCFLVLRFNTSFSLFNVPLSRLNDFW